MKPYENLAVILIIIIFGSCSSGLLVDKQKEFSLQSERTKRIVSINPSFQTIQFKEANSTKPKNNSEYYQDQFNTLLTQNALKNGVHLEIVETGQLEDKDINYFKYLAPLKKEILKSNYLQKFEEINNKDDIKKRGKLVTLYQKGPYISTQYAELAEVYGTPFFALQGVLLKRKNDNNAASTLASITPVEYTLVEDDQVEPWYYTIIADVTKAQIVYREYRKVALNISDTNLNSIIYDSFKIIAR